MACTAAYDTHCDQPWYSSIIIEVALMLGWVFVCPPIIRAAQRNRQRLAMILTIRQYESCPRTTPITEALHARRTEGATPTPKWSNVDL